MSIITKALFIIAFTAMTLSLKAQAAWTTYSELFAEASRVTDVDVRDLATLAALESSFRASVKSKTSTATGLFQFTKRTWEVTLGNYGTLYDLPPTTSRTDPWANTIMGAEYMKENERVLMRKMDRLPTLVDIYMAHLIAPRRVAALEDINHDLGIADVYPRLAKYNKSLFYVDGRSRTIHEFKDYINDKVLRAYDQYDELALGAYDSLMNTFLSAYTESSTDWWLCVIDSDVREFADDYVATMQVTELPTVKSLPMTDDAYRNAGGRDTTTEYMAITVLTDRRWIV